MKGLGIEGVVQRSDFKALEDKSVVLVQRLI